jgi:hypothetical protein
MPGRPARQQIAACDVFAETACGGQFRCKLRHIFHLSPHGDNLQEIFVAALLGDSAYLAGQRFCRQTDYSLSRI